MPGVGYAPFKPCNQVFFFSLSQEENLRTFFSVRNHKTSHGLNEQFWSLATSGTERLRSSPETLESNERCEEPLEVVLIWLH